MRKLVLALLLVALCAVTAQARPATTDERRPVTAALNDLRNQGVTIPRVRVEVVPTIDGLDEGEWYAAAGEGVIYLHDSPEKRLDAQAHFRAVGLIMKDPSRRNRALRTDACGYCEYASATAFHELVHLARENAGANYTLWDEGLADAIAFDRVLPFGKSALNYTFNRQTVLSDAYLQYTVQVRLDSAAATGRLWTSTAAQRWRLSKADEVYTGTVVEEPTLPPSDPAPGNDPGTTPDPPVPPSPPSLSWRSWDWQLSNDALALGRGVSVYDVDLEMTTPQEVAQIHAEGAQAICYVSAGTYEDWRGDAAQLLPYAGVNVDGWPGERWLKLDDPSLAGILPVMNARASSCKAKGFDAIEWDNMDSYTNGTGNTAAQQIRYNQALASIARANGLLVGLKNDVDQVAELEPSFDFAINEQCHQYNECGVYRQFLDAGKPVLVAEYGRCYTPFDPRAIVTRFTLNLDGSVREVCS